MFGIGMSGAKIEFREHAVYKTGNERVLDQGYYYMKHGTKIFPKVISVHPASDGQFMCSTERLQEIDFNKHTPAQLLIQIRDKLEATLWNHKAVLDYDWELQLRKTLSPELVVWFDDVVDHARISGFDAVCIHGDPTIDNCLFRRTVTSDWKSNTSAYSEELIMVDPLPAGGKIPPWKLVDYGKFVQSIMGYESVKYGAARAPLVANPEEVFNVITTVLTNEEKNAALFWAAVHMERMLPYADSGVVRTFAESTRDCLIRNRHGWSFDQLAESRSGILQSCGCV